MIDVQKRVEDDRARTRAIRAEVLEEKRKVAAELQQLKRRQEIESEEVRLNAADFCARLVGAAKAKSNRWRAFKRVLELAGPLPPGLAGSLESDWEKWDRCESLRWNVCDDYANKYLQWMRLRVQDVRESKNDAVHQWWVKQRRTRVAEPELLLPALTS